MYIKYSITKVQYINFNLLLHKYTDILALSMMQFNQQHIGQSTKYSSNVCGNNLYPEPVIMVTIYRKCNTLLNTALCTHCIYIMQYIAFI